MKKAYLHSTLHPCTENAMNLNLLKRWFGSNDWEVTKDATDADFIVFSTCGFVESHEKYELDRIKDIGDNKKDGAELVVLGCLPEIGQKKLETVFNGRTVRTTSLETFDEILPLPIKTTDFHNNLISEDEFDSDPHIHRYFKARKFFERLEWLPFVKVPRVFYTMPSERWWCVRTGMGCTGNCTFCAIKFAHGSQKSEPLSHIMDQVKRGVAEGRKEIALSGEDMGPYGIDIKLDLADLLNEIVAVPGDFKVNLRFIDPYWLIRLQEKLWPAFESGKIKAFCAAAQAGSDRILKKMARHYTFEELKKCVNTIVRETPVEMISTNIIVGFPTETREECWESIRLIDEIDFLMYLVYPYEDRPHTKANDFEGKIDDAEKKYRRKVVNRHAVRKHARSFFLTRP